MPLPCMMSRERLLHFKEDQKRLPLSDRNKVPGLNYGAREWVPKIAPYAYEDLQGVGRSISCVFLERPDLL